MRRLTHLGVITEHAKFELFSWQFGSPTVLRIHPAAFNQEPEYVV